MTAQSRSAYVTTHLADIFVNVAYVVIGRCITNCRMNSLEAKIESSVPLILRVLNCTWSKVTFTHLSLKKLWLISPSCPYLLPCLPFGSCPTHKSVNIARLPHPTSMPAYRNLAHFTILTIISNLYKPLSHSLCNTLKFLSYLILFSARFSTSFYTADLPDAADTETSTFADDSRPHHPYRSSNSKAQTENCFTRNSTVAQKKWRMKVKENRVNPRYFYLKKVSVSICPTK